MQVLSKFLTLATEYVPTQLFDIKSLLLTLVAYYLIRKLVVEEFFTPLAKLPGTGTSWLTRLKVNLGIVFKPEINFLHLLHQRHGPVVRMGPRKVTLGTPDLVRTVYMSYRFPKAFPYEVFDFYGDNVFSTRDNEHHKQLKKLIAPAYSQPALKDLEPLIHETGIERLIKLLYKHADSGEPVDLLYVFHLMAFDVIGEIAFGRKFGLLDEGKEDHPVVKWLDDITHLGMVRLAFGDFLGPKLFRRLKKSQEEFVEFAREAIEFRRAQGKNARSDTLQRLMEAVDPETGARLSDKQLISEAILQLIAGTDTTAVTLTWLIYRLQQNPEWLERLRKEILEAVPDLSQPVTHAAIRDLKYLNAIINETQRLHPVVTHSLDRDVPKEGIELGGYFIPHGTLVTLSCQTLHEDPEVFPDPTAFKPERWLVDEEQLAKMRQSFVPFLIGPRACSGRLLALMEMRLAIAEFIRRFKFHTPEHLVTDMTPAHKFITRPKGNKYMVILERLNA